MLLNLLYCSQNHSKQVRSDIDKLNKLAHLCAAFSVICSQILPNVCFNFHQAMKA